VQFLPRSTAFSIEKSILKCYNASVSLGAGGEMVKTSSKMNSPLTIKIWCINEITKVKNKGPSIKDVRTKSRNIDPSPLSVKCPHWTTPFPLTADVFYGRPLISIKYPTTKTWEARRKNMIMQQTQFSLTIFEGIAFVLRTEEVFRSNNCCFLHTHSGIFWKEVLQSKH